jgi:hypothetical protein
MVMTNGSALHDHEIYDFKLTNMTMPNNTTTVYNGTATITMRQGPAINVPVSIKSMEVSLFFTKVMVLLVDHVLYFLEYRVAIIMLDFACLFIVIRWRNLFLSVSTNLAYVPHAIFFGSSIKFTPFDFSSV